MNVYPKIRVAPVSNELVKEDGEPLSRGELEAVAKTINRQGELLHQFKVQGELLDQCVTLLSLVRPDIHQEALRMSGISEDTFNGFFRNEEERR